MTDTQQKEIRPNFIADKVSTVATIMTIVGTFAGLGLLLPVGAAWYLGAMAAHAGAGMLGTAGAALGGLVAGYLPYGVVDAIASRKDHATGTIEALCKPAVFVGEAVNCVLSPKYGLNKLKNAFSRASQKPASVVPQPQPAPQALAATPEAPKQG